MGLISTFDSHIVSNYNVILNKGVVDNLFNKINDKLTIDFIIDAYEYNISRELLEKEEEFKKLAIQQKPELLTKLNNLLFNG